MSIKGVNSSASDEYWDVVLERGTYAEVDGSSARTGIATSGVLSTGEVRECLAVAVCDSVEEIGYILHMPIEGMDKDEVRTSLSDFATAVLERSDQENLEAAVTGATSLEEDFISDPTGPNSKMSEEAYKRGGLARIGVGMANEIVDGGDVHDRTHLNTSDFIEVASKGSFLYPKPEAEHDYDYMH
jgi:hypothetical protein